MLVAYRGVKEWHERIATCHSGDDRYAVMTLEEDTYIASIGGFLDGVIIGAGAVVPERVVASGWYVHRFG